MSEAVDSVRRRLMRVADALSIGGVLYAVVGGNAVAAWVSRVDEAAVRNTRDVDILLRRSDLARASEVLEQAGFVYRRISSLGTVGAMDAFLEGPGGKVREAVHVIFASEKTREDQPEPNGDPADSEQAAGFRLIALEALVRMKLNAFRDKDRVHLRDLASVGLVDAGWLLRFTGTLQERLAAILDSPEG